MTSHLQVPWPDPGLFASREGRPFRILAVADEVDETLDSLATRRRLGRLDLLVGCGDLPVDYLQFVTDAFNVPLAYVRGNHDVGGSWATGDATTLHLPEPMADGVPRTDGGITLVGFNGIPFHGGGGLQRSDVTTWRAAFGAWRRLRLRSSRVPVLLVSHVAPRGINDGPDRMHRGSVPLRWLAQRLRPPLWLHGHTTLVTRRLEDRAVRRSGTLFYNAAGATLVELLPPGSSFAPRVITLAGDDAAGEAEQPGEAVA
jgi:hypothetical protein